MAGVGGREFYFSFTILYFKKTFDIYFFKNFFKEKIKIIVLPPDHYRRG